MRLCFCRTPWVTLTGGAGEGFCFDTNAIHRGTLEGHTERDVVIVTFDVVSRKSRLLNAHNNPCGGLR